MLAGPIYLDASAWVKAYVAEVGSDELNVAIMGRTDILVSELGITEVVGAVSRRKPRAGQRVQQTILDQLAEGRFRLTPLAAATHRQAERILCSGLAPFLRAADALHLALAQQAGAMTFACFDQRLRVAAAAQGMRLLPE